MKKKPEVYSHFLRNVKNNFFGVDTGLARRRAKTYDANRK